MTTSLAFCMDFNERGVKMFKKSCSTFDKLHFPLDDVNIEIWVFEATVRKHLLSSLDKIFKLQEWAIRTIANSHNRSHTRPLFVKFKVLNVHYTFNLRPPKGGCCNPPCDFQFPKQLFWANEGCQAAICNLY